MDHAEYYFFRMWPAPFSLYISGQLLLQPVIHFNHPTKVEIKLLQMANFRSPTDPTFELFQYLPFDIRLLIWELTWPGPRIISPSSPTIIHDTWVESGDLLALYLKWFYLGCGGQALSSPCYNTKIPVALHVCGESRWHTLSRYQFIPHPELIRVGLFCANFDRDVLHITDHKDLRQFRSFDRHPLQDFKTIVVMDITWRRYNAAEYAEYFLEGLPWVKKILLALSTDDIEKDTLCCDTKNPGDINENGLIKLKKHAAEKRAEYSECFDWFQGTQGTVLCIDYTG
jgi:hypothetical protein